MTYETPQLSAEDMATFLMTYPQTTDCRRRCLALFRQIHEPAYAVDVERHMMSIYDKRKTRP